MTAQGGDIRFCAACGAPLGEGAAFCGRCSRVVRSAPGAAAGAPGVTPPATRPATGVARRARVPLVAKMGIAAGALVLLGLGVKVLATGAPACTFSCAPNSGPARPDAHSFSAPSLRISFGYPDGWSSVAGSQLPRGALGALENASTGGELIVIAAKGSTPPDALAQQAFDDLESQYSVSELTDVGPVFGAEIGFVSGTGTFYSGVAQATDGSHIPVSFAVISAEHGGVWATFIGVSQDDPAAAHTGILDGVSFDDVLDRWHWPAS